MSEEGNFISELRLVETILIFTAFAVMLSLMRSFLDMNVQMYYAIIPSGLFFIFNAAKLIFDDYM